MYKVKGVDDIAEGFAHLPPVGVPDHRVKIHLRERNLPHHLLAKEDHPCHPKEQDVMTSLKELVRVEVAQIWCLWRGLEGERERERS